MGGETGNKIKLLKMTSMVHFDTDEILELNLIDIIHNEFIIKQVIIDILFSLKLHVSEAQWNGITIRMIVTSNFSWTLAA